MWQRGGVQAALIGRADVAPPVSVFILCCSCAYGAFQCVGCGTSLWRGDCLGRGADAVLLVHVVLPLAAFSVELQLLALSVPKHTLILLYAAFGAGIFCLAAGEFPGPRTCF